MTQQEYEQKREQEWRVFCNRHGIIDRGHVILFSAFFDAFDSAYALGKHQKDAETVIQGWVCRDKKDNALNLHLKEPYRTYSNFSIVDKTDLWESDCASFLPLDNSLFPDLTWESDPQECEIIIKRKKNG